jgi:transglutaminase-like putative cysteine protease
MSAGQPGAAPRAASPGGTGGTGPAQAVELFVRHDTEYEYSSQVAFAQHLAYLQPLEAAGQAVGSFELQIDPAPARLSQARDVFGNQRVYFSLTRPHDALRVRASSRVRLLPRFDGIELADSPPWERVRESLQFVAGAPFQDASEFCFPSPHVPREAALGDYARKSFGAGTPLLAGALELMHCIHRDFRYDAQSTDVSTTVMEAFAARAGVCQDFSHVMISCLRSLGLAARYVSGYLHTRARYAATPGAAPRPAAEVVGADASHAWVAVHCPRHGWVEFDPTNDAIPGTSHVRLACGRDYGDVAPLRGVVQGGGEHELRVAVEIRSIDDPASGPGDK